MLFIWIAAVGMGHPDDAEMARRAIFFCDRALTFADSRDPWNALRDWWRWRLGEIRQPPALPEDPARETSARACFQWGLLSRLRPGPGPTLTWLERACFLRPDDYWSQFVLAYFLEQVERVDGALQHYEAAVALRPTAPWAWYHRAHLYASRREAWEYALRDLDLAVSAADVPPADQAKFRIERGKVRQAVGDVRGARADFEAVIAADPTGRFARDARIDRARLFAQAGAIRRARAEYDALLDADPSDRIARLARARLAMRQGRAADAEGDFTRLLSESPGAVARLRADWLGSRALARLALGRIAEAESDVDEANRLDRSPTLERTQARVALKTGRPIDERLLHPDAIVAWPVAGPALIADLHAAVERLGPAASGRSKPPDVAAIRARAAMLSALGQHTDAAAEADRAINRSPSGSSYALRCEIRLRAGDRAGTLDDVTRGLASMGTTHAS